MIDDLANRSCDCDLLLDQTFGRNASDYEGLVPETAEILAGAAYALLRHLGPGRVLGGADLEQFCYRLRRPYDVQLPQRRGKIVARQGSDLPPEEI